MSSSREAGLLDVRPTQSSERLYLLVGSEAALCILAGLVHGRPLRWSPADIMSAYQRVVPYLLTTPMGTVRVLMCRPCPR